MKEVSYHYRILFLVLAIMLMSFSAIVLGAIASPRVVNYQPPSSLKLDPAYCLSVGDDNCDGIVMNYESGWACVPPEGGPINCTIQIKEVK